MLIAWMHRLEKTIENEGRLSIEIQVKSPSPLMVAQVIRALHSSRSNAVAGNITDFTSVNPVEMRNNQTMDAGRTILAASGWLIHSIGNITKVCSGGLGGAS